MDMTNAFSLLKQDLGISHNKRDDYLTHLLETCLAELSDRGVSIEEGCIDDIMLLSDYAAWRYRNRDKDVPLANNLIVRIRNKQTKRRCGK